MCVELWGLGYLLWIRKFPWPGTLTHGECAGSEFMSGEPEKAASILGFLVAAIAWLRKLLGDDPVDDLLPLLLSLSGSESANGRATSGLKRPRLCPKPVTV